MVSEQESKCAICEKHVEKLHVDHCHDTGKVRGLLCTTCNHGLGKLGDNLDGLFKAVRYLEKSKNG